MKYTMNVTIYDPETREGMSSDIFLSIDCNFIYDEEQYGNGHYVSLKNKMLPFGKEVIDLRYDGSFDKNKKEEWLKDWAKNFWTGECGAYAIKEIKITKNEK